MKEGSIFSIVNQKGGVGKTTTAINLASGVGLSGKKVLLIDLDPQANCSSGLGAVGQQKHTIVDVLKESVSLDDCIIEGVIQNVDIIPSEVELFRVAEQLWRSEKNSVVLKNLLASCQEQYDIIFLDCPPSLNMLTLNAIIASRWVIVPVQSQYFALEGLSQIIKTIQSCRSKVTTDLDVAAIILTMYSEEEPLSQSVEKEIKKYFKEVLFETKIHTCSSLAEAPSHGKPIVYYDPRSTGAEDYVMLTYEFLSWMKKMEENN